MIPEREQRIMELATGFALGELEETELRELYDALREPGEQGTAAARVTWEALGTAVDLRADRGTSFQDALYLRLKDGGSAGFETRVRTRLGISRPRLAPVEQPEPAPPRATTGTLLAVLAGLLLIGLLLVIGRGERPVARITGLNGTVTIDERVLTIGAGIDRRPLVVPLGAQAVLEWPDGSTAIVAGPASAVAGERSLALLGGRAWVAASAGFALGLPDSDKVVELAAGTRCAVEIRDGRSLVGVATGRVGAAGAAIEAGHALDVSAHAAPYPWRYQEGLENAEPARRAVAAAASLPDWRWRGTLAWSDLRDRIELRLDGRDGALSISAEPGRLTVSEGGRELHRLALSGAPLASRPFVLASDQRGVSLDIAGQRLQLATGPGERGLAWALHQQGRIEAAVFHSGPDPRPPLPSPQPITLPPPLP